MHTRDRRGQLILVAAFGLAVAFVVLALVLNSVVFTENLATRNHDQTDTALAFEGAVEGGVGGLIAEANADQNADYSSLWAELDAAVPRWSDNATYLGAARGSLRSASLTRVDNGTRIVQSADREFTDGSGNADWTLAPGVDDARRFHVLASPATDGGFAVTVANGSASWSVTVSEDDSDSSQTAVVVRRNGSIITQTQRDANTVEIDLTEGLVAGQRVDNWTFGAGVPAPYDVSISNGNDVTGKYVLVVDRLETPLRDAQPAGTYTAAGDPGPTTIPALYRAFVDVSVRTDVLTYETTLSVAPEEPARNETYVVGS